MDFNYLPELVCGDGYTFDWDAISSISTFAAVLVALWIANSDKRIRRKEQLALEARAASMVNMALSGFAEIHEKIIDNIKEFDGLTIDIPGSDVLHGVEECQYIIDRESFFHQLPIGYVEEGELVLSLARKWIREIDVRQKVQNDPKLRNSLNWRDTKSIERLSALFKRTSVNLREKCKQTMDEFSQKKKPLIERLIEKITDW